MATEYRNNSFEQFCTNHKIKREYTVPENPEQNGVTERNNRTVVETARSLLIESKLPNSYWLGAVDTAVHIRILVRKDKTDKAPSNNFGVGNRKQGI